MTTQGLTVPMKFGLELTIDEALREFCKEVEKPELIGTNQIHFLYNATSLKFGEEKTIFEFFSKNVLCPKVMVIDASNCIGDSYIHSQLKKENNKLNQQISNLMQINNNLQQQLFQANLTINSNISNNINEEKYFESGDGQIRRGIQCMKNEIFAEVEEKLYKFYEEFRDTNNTFIANGNCIKRFKTIEESNIKNGDKVLLETI